MAMSLQYFTNPNRKNEISTVAGDALALCITKSSVVMALADGRIPTTYAILVLSNDTIYESIVTQCMKG